MRRFEALLWDVDGTLLDFLYSQRCAITKCFETIGIQITDEMVERYRQINDRYWKRLELGEVTKEELLTGRFLILFEEYGITGVDVEAFRREYQRNLGLVYSYLDDSLEICRGLKGKVRQYVITNGVTWTQETKLKHSGLAECMEELFISETIGAPKPQKAFFDACLERMEERLGTVDKSRLLIVGDSLSSDIKGGVIAGIPTCWYRPDDIFEKDSAARELYEQYRPDYEINNLHQILALLEPEE